MDSREQRIVTAAIITLFVVMATVLTVIITIVIVRVINRPNILAACDTEECRQAKAYLHGLLSKDHHPCEDFYMHVCGSWFNKSSSFLGDIRSAFLRQLNSSLFRRRQATTKYGMHVMRVLYKSCHEYLSAETSMADDLKAFVEILNTTELVTLRTPAALMKFCIRVSLTYGMHTVCKLRFVKVNKRMFLHFSSGTSLNNKLSLGGNVKQLEIYVGEILEVTPHDTDTPTVVKEVGAFDQKVDKALQSAFPQESYGEFDRVLSSVVKGLKSKDWQESINSIVPQSLRLHLNDTIKLTGLELFKDLAKTALAPADPSLVALYLAVHLTSEALALHYEKLRVRSSPEPAIYFCLEISRTGVTNTWPYLVESVFSGRSNAETIGAMFEAIRSATQKGDMFLWMQTFARSRAIDKIGMISLTVADPDPPVVAVAGLHYSDLDPLDTSNASFPSIYLRARNADQKQRLKNIPTIEVFSIINAQLDGGLSYVPTLRNIIVPTLYQVPPLFYAAEVPMYYNYGTVGVAIANHISDAVGAVGSKLNEEGRPGDWWNKATWLEYNKTVACLKDLHKTLQFEDQMTNDENESQWQNELHMRAQGARLAFNGLQSHFAASVKPEQFLTHWAEAQETFFLRFCLSLCDGVDTRRPLTPRENCMLPLHNMPEFAKIFKCDGRPTFKSGTCPL